MKLGDIYKHKIDGSIIQIECFASHIKEINPFKTIIVFSNIVESIGMYGSCPSFNGYGSKEEIEDEYELAIPQEDLAKYDSWEEIIETIKNQNTSYTIEEDSRIITSVRNRKGYINGVTKFLDEYLIKCENYSDFYYNYICDEPFNDDWAIRVPGATRGHIKIKDGVITEIKLYEDSFCYDEKVYDNLDKFIGMKIDLK